MSELRTATLAGGCFWCLDAVYRGVEGVARVESGYAGGDVPDPSYEQVCTGTTGHAEVVRVEYDPDAISYRELLDIFFSIHDPTTKDRQGNDVGPQYRSAIFAHDDEQARIARETVAELDAEGIWDAPIVTEIAPLDTYYPAEAYHQDFFAKNPTQGYCAAVVGPKVAKFRARWAHRLRSA